jgi:hypothetical protein
MKYDTPELTALTLAVNVIQHKPGDVVFDNVIPEADKESSGAYADWE